MKKAFLNYNFIICFYQTHKNLLFIATPLMLNYGHNYDELVAINDFINYS